MHFVLRLVLCTAIAVLAPASALAAKRGETVSVSHAQAAAEKGNQQAAAALNMTVDREACLNECSNRGNDKRECASACRPGLCHLNSEQPYCVER